MSTIDYSFNFCKSILKNSQKKRIIPPKKGDVIFVPEYTEEIPLLINPNRKKPETPLLQHDKLSNSTISDFGNSFNSDIKSFLSNIYLT